MSTDQSERGRETLPSEAINLQSKSFKLRFASQRELGRSYVSAIKPLGLPAVVRGEEHAGEGTVAAEAQERALRHVEELFRKGPREKYAAPVTSAHEYGWWSERREAALYPRHHVADSAWLKERLRVVAADRALRRP